jgi:hypothetical protein
MPSFDRRIAAAVALVGGVCVAGACLPGGGPALDPYVDNIDAAPPTFLDDGSVEAQDVDLGDPFAIVGLNPSHGPFNGGTRTTITGRGFPSDVVVTVGGTTVPQQDILASDPTHAAITTPAGAPGAADVTVVDPSTSAQRVLSAGFFYDAFAVEPASGATSGGTRVELTGSGTAWGAGATVLFDGMPCTAVDVVDSTHIQCLTPADAPGTKAVIVTNADGMSIEAQDAYTYSDSTDGYRGGLSGGVLAGSMRVLMFDDWTGEPIPGGTAIVGGDLATAVVGTADVNGVVQLTNAALTGAVTVTVAAKCHQPMTFVAVPVDTVTAYLDPTLTLSCAMGDPPSSGNYGSTDQGEISGQLVWSGAEEQQRPPWTNVPTPQSSTERQAAYVFVATGSPTDTFSLPDPSTATTPMSPGGTGYDFQISLSPGNETIYALAGIENRSLTPPTFIAYAMGVVRGVAVSPDTITTEVDIPMTTILDHVVTIAPTPPPPGPHGPDRFFGQLAVTVGMGNFALIPTGNNTTLLPVGGNIAFSGVPALDGTLTGEQYTITASAVTGPNLGVPASIVTRIETTDSNTPVTVGGFVGIPVLGLPLAGASWSGTHLTLTEPGSVDLFLIDIQSGGGLVTWEIVAPGGVSDFGLPDLSMLPNSVGLVNGAIQTTAYAAAVPSFDYGTLRYGQLSSGAWNAYAINSNVGSY